MSIYNDREGNNVIYFFFTHTPDIQKIPNIWMIPSKTQEHNRTAFFKKNKFINKNDNGCKKIIWLNEKERQLIVLYIHLDYETSPTQHTMLPHIKNRFEVFKSLDSARSRPFLNGERGCLLIQHRAYTCRL